MKHAHFSRRLTALTVVSAAALLVACGGGESSPTAAESFVTRMATETPAAGTFPAMASRATRASVVTITNNQLFQWAQLRYPELFGSAAPVVIANLPYQGQLFDVREFPGGNFLGISQGRVYGLGPFTNGVLQDFGVVQSYAAEVCGRLNCGNNSGGNSGGATGALNGCMLPAGDALRTGNRFAATYQNDVFLPERSSGEFTTESLVEGGASFEGQSAIRISTRTRGVQQGQAIDFTAFSFNQIAENGLVGSLGSESTIALGPITISTRTVNTPPLLNIEFTLQPGQSIDQTFSATTTYINSPFPSGPTSLTSTQRFTYEARETISVFGRSYDTCRYKSTDGGDEFSLEWYIFGKGIPARIEGRNNAGALLLRSDLRSGNINGTAL